METEEFETWDGAMKSQTFTAHPKIDPKTGNMVAIGYAASGPVQRRRVLHGSQPERRAGAREVVQGPLLLHDARLRDHRGLPRAAHRALDQQLGAARSRARPHFGFDTTMPVYLGHHPAPRRPQGRRHPLVQARQLLRQPRGQRLAGRDQGPLRHPRGEEQHVPVLPRHPRRAVQRRRGDEQADPLDGRHGEQRRRVRRDRAAHRDGERVPADRRPLHRREEPLHLGPRDGHEPAQRAQGRQRRRLPDELPVPQGPRNRRANSTGGAARSPACRNLASSRASTMRPKAMAGS